MSAAAKDGFFFLKHGRGSAEVPKTTVAAGKARTQAMRQKQLASDVDMMGTVTSCRGYETHKTLQLQLDVHPHLMSCPYVLHYDPVLMHLLVLCEWLSAA